MLAPVFHLPFAAGTLLCIAMCKQFRVNITEGINYEHEQKKDKFTQLSHGWTTDVHATERNKFGKELVMQMGSS